jgi:hypothetical protein
MRTRLTERDLSRIVRRVINEQDPKSGDVDQLITTLEIMKDGLQDLDDDSWRRVKEMKREMDRIIAKIESQGLPDKLPTLPPREIENDLDMDFEY